MDAQRVEHLVVRLAEAQHGVVARRQLYALGLGRGAVESWIERGRLHRLHRGVYALGHTCLTADGRWAAAVAACGPGAALSHRSAAALWDLLPTGAATIDVTVPVAGGRRRRRGLRIHRCPAAATTTRRGIRVTTPAQTLRDLAPIVGARALARAVEQVEVQRLDVGALATTARGRLAAVLAETRPPTRSVLEDRLLALCAARGVGAPEVNVIVEGLEVDFLWRAERVVAETDGFEHHGTRTAFERDRARDAHLARHGYRVLRFTWRQVTREPAAVAAALATVLVRT
jgi:hypothetical protein